MAVQVTSSDRLAHIDGMRAIAALSVGLHHVAESAIRMTGAEGPVVDAINSVLYEYVDFGRLGVMLFFVISGYCIANSILRPGPHPVVHFAINRIFRIYPLYWVSLLAAFFIFGDKYSTADYTGNILLAQQLLDRPFVLGVYWTLPIELTFYGLCIVLFVFGMMGTTQRLQAVAIGLFGFSVFAGISRPFLDLSLPYAWPYFLSLMVSGAVLRRLDDAGANSARLIACIGCAALAGIFLISVTVYGDAAVHGKPWYLDFIPNASAVLLFLGFSYVYRLKSSFLAYLGRISYSLYLFHILVIILTMRVLSAYGDALAGLGIPGVLGAMTLLFVATILVSSATYHLVEQPSIQAGRRVSGRLSRRSVAA